MLKICGPNDAREAVAAAPRMRRSRLRLQAQHLRRKSVCRGVGGGPGGEREWMCAAAVAMQSGGGGGVAAVGEWRRQHLGTPARSVI